MDRDSTWTNVSSLEDFSNLLDKALDFHDAVATLACWEGAEDVNSAGEMEMDGYGVLTLRFKSQFREVLPLELKFLDVRVFRYEYELDFEPSIVFGSKGISVQLLSWEIKANGLQYRSLKSQGSEMSGEG